VFGNNEHYEIKPRRSKQSLLQLLNRLVRVNQSLHTENEPDRDAFNIALRRAREVLRPGSLVIVICDERTLTEGAEQQLSLLSRHCDLLLLPVSDPLDHALPAAGLLRFAERGAQLELDTLNFELRQTYRAQAEARIARWELLAQKLRVLLMPLSTQSEMVEQLREYLNPQKPGKGR
jgi:uncharacterized protein (DUF58 family)